VSASELLEELRRRGVELVVIDRCRLHWYAPHGALTPELESALRTRQAELIALLLAPTQPQQGAQRILVQPGPPGHISYAHLAFWRWLVERGRAESPPAGPPAGPYARSVALWQQRFSRTG